MNDILINQQRIRKQNLKNIIDQHFNGKVEEFAKRLDKNKFFIYGLLWEIEKPASRNITDKTARLIERHLRLPDGFLDAEVHSEIQRVYFIPFIDISESEANKVLSLSDESSFMISKQELINNQLDPETLVALRIIDDSMSNGFDIADIVIIDRAKTNFLNNKIYFIRHKSEFLLRKLSRSQISSDKIIASATNLNKTNEFKDFEVQNASKIEIIGAPVISIKYLKGF